MLYIYPIIIIQTSSLGYVRTVLPPTAPQNLKATSGESYVNLTWSVPNDLGGASVENYSIYRNNSPSSKIDTIVPNTEYNDTSVNNGVTYNYSVTAINSQGESNFSNNISITPQKQPKSLIDLYDTNNDNNIEGNEVRQAIRCFLFGTNNVCINNQGMSGSEIRQIIQKFLFG